MEIQEFMVAKNKYGEYGVIIRNDLLTFPFRVVYTVGGQILGPENFALYITELYVNKSNDLSTIMYNALQFLADPEVNIKNYELAWSADDKNDTTDAPDQTETSDEL